MDRLVKFSGPGPEIIVNPKYVAALKPYRWRDAPRPLTTIFVRGFVGEEAPGYTVAGTPEQVAEALGYQLVVFDPATGLSEGSREGVE